MSAKFTRASQSASAASGFDLDAALLAFNPNDALRWRDVLGGGCLVMGDSGSGKTSAVLTSLTLAAHRAGACVVHNAVKPSDAALWQSIARWAGRDTTSFRIAKDAFNPIAHEQFRASAVVGASGLVESLTQMILQPLKMQSREGGGEAFWRADAARYIRHLITIALIAGEALSFQWIARSLDNLPISVEETRDPAWRARCPAFTALLKASARSISAASRSDLEASAEWLLQTCPNTPDRTRMSTIATITSSIDALLRGEVGATLNAASDTWTPDVIVSSPGVLILDCPLQVHGPVGTLVQRMLISSIQRAALRRTITPATRPLVFVLDEFQEILDPEDDPPFMRTARDRMACMVIATQGVSGIKAACGQSRDPRAAAESILGLPGTKIFASTTDPSTLEYASGVFAQTPQTRVSFGTSTPTAGGAQGSDKASRSTNVSRDLQPEVPPFELTRLKRGGPENNFLVEAFVSVSGRVWRTNHRTSLKVAFQQMRISGG